MARSKGQRRSRKKREAEAPVIHWGIFEDIVPFAFSPSDCMVPHPAQDPQVTVVQPSRRQLRIQARGPTRQGQGSYIAQVTQFSREYRYNRVWSGRKVGAETSGLWGDLPRPILLNIRARESGFYVLFPAADRSLQLEQITEEFFRVLLQASLPRAEQIDPLHTRTTRAPAWGSQLMENLRSSDTFGIQLPGWMPVRMREYYTALWPEAQEALHHADTMEEGAQFLDREITRRAQRTTSVVEDQVLHTFRASMSEVAAQNRARGNLERIDAENRALGLYGERANRVTVEAEEWERQRASRMVAEVVVKPAPAQGVRRIRLKRD